MKFKLLLTVVAIGLSPSLALAGGGCQRGEHKVTASSCVPGLIWDEVLAACVVPTNS